MLPIYRHKRRTLTQVRTYRDTIASCRPSWGSDVGALIRILGRIAWRVPVPRCVYRRRWERMAQEWEATRAASANRPPPPPLPDGFVHGFSNGTEYDMWTSKNCDRCALAGDPGEAGSSRCAIFEMIHDAAASDGLFPTALAKRMGYLDAGPGEINRCPERVPMCPTCEAPLELYANGDNGPSDDRWTCDTCGIEYPHTQFPLPHGYVRSAKAAGER